MFIYQVEVPLNTAKKLILLSADKYDTVFALRQYVSGNTSVSFAMNFDCFIVCLFFFCVTELSNHIA